MMQALRKMVPGPGLSLCEVPAPASPGPGEVVVEVEAAGICGTDVHIDDWSPGYAHMSAAMPVTLGHEFCGTLATLGAGTSALAEGSRVVVRPSVICGRCEACRAGETDECGQRRGLGIARDGAFAPFVAVPAANCVPVPDGLDPEIAALAEPMTVSAEAVDTAGVRLGSRVLVLGPGTIGQGVALFAEAAGAAEVVVAGQEDAMRLAGLREMGFPHVLDLAGQPLEEVLAPYLARGKFDVVIEATGVPAVVPQALDVLRKRGLLVVCGIHPRPAAVDLTRLVREHQQIRGSYRAPPAAWPRVLAYLAANSTRVRRMITHRLPLASAISGLNLARTKQASKVMVFPSREGRA